MKPLLIIIILTSVFVGCTADVNVRELEISTNMLDFGLVGVNKNIFKTIDLYNNTQKPLEINFELFNNVDEDYELITNSDSEIVQPDATLQIEVKIRPKSQGTKLAKLKLSYNHVGSPNEIDLQAECIRHDVQLVPFEDTIEFRYAIVNSASLKILYVQNIGNAESTIEKVSFSETNNFFIKSCDFPLTLEPGQSQMLDLYFTPNKTGLTTDVMQIYLDSSTKPYETNLTGNGVLPYVVEYLKKEYFDEDKLPKNWSVEGVNNCWEIGKPDLDTGFRAYSGNYCAGTMIASNYLDNSDTRLVSPEVDLSQSRSPVLSFVQRLNTVYEQWGDGGFIEIRSRDPQDPDNWSVWEFLPSTVPVYSVDYFNDTQHAAFAGFEEENVWKQVSVVLHGYQGKVVQIAWHFVSDGSESDAGWYIDDVYVFEVRTNIG